MGHKSVKAALVAKLAADLPGWTDQKPWVARGDFLPADAKRWPFVMVRTTRMQAVKYVSATTMVCTYRCEVTCGVRSASGERDAAFDDATGARDDLIEAVRWVLRGSRDLGSDMRVTNGELTEETAPAVLEGSGPAIAMGTTTFTVSATESVPDPSGYIPPESVAFVDLSVSGLAADQNLPT